MSDYADAIAIKIGRIDAFLCLVIWAFIALISATNPSGALPIIIFLLAPASALVGWRGTVFTRLFLADIVFLRHAVIEGASWGAAYVSIIWLWGAANSAFAAGNALDGLSPTQAEFWHAVAVTLLPAIGIGGILGALHGVTLFYLNRWLVKRLASRVQ